MQIAHEAQQPQSTHTAVRRQKRTETASSRTSAQAADVDSSNGARQCTGALGRPGSSTSFRLVAAIRGLKYMTERRSRPSRRAPDEPEAHHKKWAKL